MNDYLGRPWSPFLENHDMKKGNERWNGGANLGPVKKPKPDEPKP